MRSLFTIFLLLSLSVASLSTHAAEAGKVIKVLPQYLDLQGRASIAPSLYERDSYQSQLRNHPDQRSGIVFNVCSQRDKDLKLIVEARGVIRGKTPSLVVLEQTAPKNGFFKRWTKFTITGEDFKKIDTLTAWRASLWDGNQLVSEYKSFLW